MSMPAVTSWCWDMAGVLLPLWVRFGPTIFYMCHRRLRTEHNLGLLIPFGPALSEKQAVSFREFCTPEARFPRTPLLGSSVNSGNSSSLEKFPRGEAHAGVAPCQLLWTKGVDNADEQCIDTLLVRFVYP